MNWHIIQPENQRFQPDLPLYHQPPLLHSLCPNWKWLCDENQYRIPLPIHSYGPYKRIMQPLFLQRFSLPIHWEIPELVRFLTANFHRIVLAVEGANYQNLPETNVLPNYVLDLSQNDFEKNYSNQFKRNIKLAKQIPLDIREISIKKIAQLYIENSLSKIEGIQPKNIQNFLNGIQSFPPEWVKAWSVFENNQPIAGFLSIQDKKSLYYHFPFSNERGREIQAMAYLLDWIFKKYHGNVQNFDFEGSRHPGIARFFASTGAKANSYYRIDWKIVPWLYLP